MKNCSNCTYYCGIIKNDTFTIKCLKQKINLDVLANGKCKEHLKKRGDLLNIFFKSKIPENEMRTVDDFIKNISNYEYSCFFKKDKIKIALNADGKELYDTSIFTGQHMYSKTSYMGIKLGNGIILNISYSKIYDIIKIK